MIEPTSPKFEFARNPEFYQFTCDNYGRKFTVQADEMPVNWKKINIISINCTNCKKPKFFI